MNFDLGHKIYRNLLGTHIHTHQDYVDKKKMKKKKHFFFQRQNNYYAFSSRWWWWRRKKNILKNTKHTLTHSILYFQIKIIKIHILLISSFVLFVRFLKFVHQKIKEKLQKKITHSLYNFNKYVENNKMGPKQFQLQTNQTTATHNITLYENHLFRQRKQNKILHEKKKHKPFCFLYFIQEKKMPQLDKVIHFFHSSNFCTVNI